MPKITPPQKPNSSKSKQDILDLVKKRLRQFSDASNKSSGLWKPTGEHTIRLVPYKYSDYPFIELYFHYDFAGKNLLSPISFDLPDPIVETAEKLKASGDKESYKLAMKLYPKMRTYVPVLVRGEEDQGIRFFGMGKTVYEEILKIMDDPDYGNIFDPYTGTDLVITYQTPEEVGNDFGKTSIRAKRNTSRLADSDEKIEEYLNNQKPITDIYKMYTYDELFEILKEWLNSDREVDTEEKPKKSAVSDKVSDSEEREEDYTDAVKKADEAFDKLFKNKK